MIRSLFNLLYGSTSVEFRSAFGLEDSVARLQAATRRFSIMSTQQAAAGRVSPSRVRLQRVIPMVGNSFKPFFFGRFEVRGDGVYLTGRFTMHWLAKAFMTFWLGGVLFAGITASVTATTTQGGDWVGILFTLAMFAAGVGFVALGKWFSRNDVAWLSNVMGSALGTASVPAAVRLSDRSTLDRDPASSAVPPLAALVLALLGLLSVAGAISGVSSWNNGDITRFASQWSRTTAALFGFGMLAMASGVYARKQWAWRLVLVFLGVAGLWPLADLLLSSPVSNIAPRIIVGAVSALVMIYWCRWWYAQRVHFSR